MLKVDYSLNRCCKLFHDLLDIYANILAAVLFLTLGQLNLHSCLSEALYREQCLGYLQIYQVGSL